MRLQHQRHGFSLLELIIVILIVGTLIGMLLPAVRRVRGPARRTTCMNNLRQLCLAALNYETAHMHLPSAAGGFLRGDRNPTDAKRMSGFVHLLPFMEQNATFETISNDLDSGNVKWDESYTPWTRPIQILQCPSSAAFENPLATTHYAFCIGDAARDLHSSKTARGAFLPNLKTQLQEVTDGTSNTIAFGEIGDRENQISSRFAVNASDTILERPAQCFDLVDSIKPNGRYLKDVEVAPIGRGGHWGDGLAGVALFNTILKPGSPSASVAGAGSDGIFSSAVHHEKMTLVVFLDGSTHALSKDIDCGNADAPTLLPSNYLDQDSPYRVWGRLGSATDGEPVDGY